jgi:cystathionine gamma-synthase
VPEPLRPESLAVCAGRPAPTPDAPLTTPVVLTAPYHHSPEDNRYSRHDATETVRAWERGVAALEGGPVLAFGSGMAAVAAVAESQRTGAVAVVPAAAYSGTVRIFQDLEERGRLEVRRVDIANSDAVLAALDGADLLWLETVTNPLLEVPDLPVLIDAARAAGVRVCVDATFSTPLIVRPLDMGADVVMHSATKYLSGHSDVLMGVVATRSPELLAAMRDRRSLTGAVPGALECYLALRGLRTLALRMERAQSNALVLARRLDRHPRVARVRFPGLPDDPGHERARRFHDGFGAMVSFELAGAAQDAEAVCEAVRLITHATSLGGVESLIERRARHAVDAACGTPPTLLRLSVGIEHVEDLWADLATALDS